MPADFSEYINLTVFDQEPGEIYLNSIELARLTLPEFNLRPGTPEDAIFQAMAYIGWQNVTAINRIPDRLMAGILAMMGVTRQDPTPAQLNILITADSYEGATIPSGTLFGFESIFEDEVTEYVFQTIEPLVINAVSPASAILPGDPYPTGVVTAECLTPGVIPTISVGQPLSILSPSTDILEAEAGSISGSTFVNGVNEDTDAEYLSRCVSYLASLSGAINKASQVDSYIATSFPGIVTRVKTFDLTYGEEGLGDIHYYYDANPVGASRSSDVTTIEFSSAHKFADGDIITVSNVGASANGFDVSNEEVISTTETTITYSNVGSDVTEVISDPDAIVFKGEDVAGYVTIFLYGFGENVSSANKESIKALVSERTVAGLIFDIRDFSILQLSLEIDVTIDSNYEVEAIQSIVKSTIVDYLSPLNFPSGNNLVRATELISLISNIPGVRYVGSVDIQPIDEGWLPKVDNDLYFRYKGSLPSLEEEDLTINFEAT